jgi:hypothetical protein
MSASGRLSDAEIREHLMSGVDDSDFVAGESVAVGAVLVSRKASEVEPERVEWLWGGWLPRGKLVMLDGDPGGGKSTITASLAARVSRGVEMPDGSQGCEAADVAVLSAEDGAADTIRPRLEAAGADLERVHIIDAVRDGDETRLPEIPGDLVLLEQLVTDTGAKLVVVDPIVAYLPGSTDAHKDQSVRRALAPLARLAERTGATVVSVRHLNKAGGSRAMYRGGGSIAFIGAARVGLLAAADPDDETGDRRVLAVVKSNLAETPDSLAYTLRSDHELGCGVIEWQGASSHSADDLLRAPQSDEERSALDEAKDFLQAELDEGPVLAADIKAKAQKDGIKDITLRRAKSSLEIVSERAGFGPGSEVYWGLRRIGDQAPPEETGEHLCKEPSTARDIEGSDAHRCSHSGMSTYGDEAAPDRLLDVEPEHERDSTWEPGQ